MVQSLSREVVSSTENWLGAYDDATFNGDPQFKIPRGLLSYSGKMALDYVALGYRPIPLIRNTNGAWVPAVKWASFQHETPTIQEIIDWWIKYPYAGVALICGLEAGLLVLDVDPRHGGVDPKLTAPVCSTPRFGAHYHFTAPEPIPEIKGQGLEWLGDGHIARVPPTPGYSWINSGLPPRDAIYKSEDLPPMLRSSHRLFLPPSVNSRQGDLCEVLSQAPGRVIHPGTNIRCFCHTDREPSLAIYPDHAYCFSQNRFFSRNQVLQGLGLTHLIHIEDKRHLYELNVPDGSLMSISPTGITQKEEKERLAVALKELGLIDKAKEVEMCGQWVSREKTKLVKTRTCEDCGATFVVQSRCHSRFCPECAAIEAKYSLQRKESVFKNTRSLIIRLPLPPLVDKTSVAFSKAKKEVLDTLRRTLGRKCGSAYHKILVGCRNSDFRWQLVVLGTEADVQKLQNSWPYGKTKPLEGLTAHQTLILYVEVTSRPPEWETTKDLATLDAMLFRQRLTGSHGEAHGNSQVMRGEPKIDKVVHHCPVCGGSNLSRPIYRDASGVQWINGIPLWFSQSSDRSPPSSDQSSN